jgi:hypothetical protein
MITPRVPPLLAGILVALAGCTSRAGSGGNVSGAVRDFLHHYGNFSPAEATEIVGQMERGPHDLAVQLAAARREGILLKVTALQPALPAPERNAAPIYTRLMHLLKVKPLDPATDKVRGSLGVRVTHSPEEVAAVRRVLSERKDMMQLVHEAANKPACIFRRDWTRGILMVYPENATMREAARLLSAESYFLAQAGRYREAIANQARIFRVAQHPTSDPIAISQLVGMACDSIALAGFENILCVAGPNPEAAEAVRATVAARRPRFRLRRTLEGEIAAPGLVTGGLITRAVQARAQEEAIIAGAALLAYKGRRGAFPDRLEDAAATPMRDPFSIGPLKYRREGAGFVVYSVGPDGNFDGGKPGAPRDRHQAYFRYPTTLQPPQPDR